MSRPRAFLPLLSRVLLCASLFGLSACAATDRDDATDDELASLADASEGVPDTVTTLDAITQAIGVSSTLPSGKPFDVRPEDGFKYFEIAGAVCRSGTPAGVAVRKSRVPSTKVLVYLQGGGGCFNTQTCLPQANPDRIAENHRLPSNAGIFSTTNTLNPFADWNVVYVPYCTGDFHMGNNVASVPLGPSNQKFVGRKNLELILPGVLATFPGSTKVALAGSSAGGAGATGNAIFIKTAFSASAPAVYVLNDAGPYLSSGNNFFNDYMPVAQQAKLKKLWGLDKTVLPECGTACDVANYLPAAAKRLSSAIGRKPILTIGKQDTVVALLYANARVDQYPLFGLVGVDMQAALNDLRTRMAGTWSTYYVTGPFDAATQHMWLLGDNFYTVSQNPVAGGARRTLVSWVRDYLDDVPLPEVGP